MPSEVKTDYVYIDNIAYAPSGAIQYQSTSKLNSAERSRSWSQTANYHALVNRKNGKRGVVTALPNHPYSDYRSRTTNAATVIKYYDSWWGRTAEQTCPFMVVTPPQCIINTGSKVFVELYDKCMKKLPAKMNGTSFNIPLFLAEYTKTIDMIQNAVKLIKRQLKQKKNIESAWLEYRYGWRTLCMDIHDACKALYDARQHGVRQKVKVTSTYECSGMEDRVVTSHCYPYGSIPAVSASGTQKFGVTMTLNYTESLALARLQQFGITNPAALIWELIPFSFVIDWFVSVGDFISSLDTFVGKDFHSGTVSYWLEEKDKYFCNAPVANRINDTYGNAWQILSVSPTSVETWARRYKREVLTSFPTVSLPTIQFGLNTLRSLDALALAIQPWRRR